MKFCKQYRNDSSNRLVIGVKIKIQHKEVQPKEAARRLTCVAKLGAYVNKPWK